jgi:hypothetical protein
VLCWTNVEGIVAWSPTAPGPIETRSSPLTAAQASSSGLQLWTMTPMAPASCALSTLTPNSQSPRWMSAMLPAMASSLAKTSHPSPAPVGNPPSKSSTGTMAAGEGSAGNGGPKAACVFR